MDHVIPAIELSGVWIRYGQNVLLEDINLKVEEKEIISIVGPNGSGKSTILKCIMGFKDTFRGSIKVFGRDPKEVQQSGIFGYLPQGNHHDINFPIDVYNVVAMARYSKRGLFEKLKPADRDIINGTLEKVEMADFRKHHFGSLSGGQKQRVLIARALATRPKILILDEPSTGLDAVAQDRFYELLKTLRDSEGLTIVMVSHDIGTVSRFVDRLACVKQRLHFHGRPEDCASNESLAKVFGKNTYFISHDKNCETCMDRK
ncbi:MAG TPA: metal ABC transporter ATP-binding protein [Spirochaetota bacterium]|nr:metal ABC transporter ATP-binding protein [Spirochaetota bacterium]